VVTIIFKFIFLSSFLFFFLSLFSFWGGGGGGGVGDDEVNFQMFDISYNCHLLQHLAQRNASLLSKHGVTLLVLEILNYRLLPLYR
jgi:hypothetical protein